MAPHTPHDGKQPAIHTEWVYGWLGEAIYGTGLSSPDGTGAYHVDDRVRNEAAGTWWGQALHDLYTTDRASSPGWSTTTGGLRPPWWSRSRHERGGTEKLIGWAAYPTTEQASIAAVPGVSQTNFPTLMPPPLNQAEWLAQLRNKILKPEQYEQLRKLLNLPPATDPLPCPGGGVPPCPVDPDPPEPPDPPVCPDLGQLRAWLNHALTDIQNALSALPP